MLRPSFFHAPDCERSQGQGFTILEVLVAVSIAIGVISVLAPALTRQVALGEQSNRLTAVEAVVSRDLDWFSNYARLWKLKVGSYSIIRQITTASSYTSGGAAIYEPPPLACNETPNSSTGLAASLLIDAKAFSATLSGIQKVTYQAYLPPYEINTAPSTTRIAVTGGGVSGLDVIRTVTPVGNKLRILYRLDGANATGLNFTREASLLVEASAWCDRLP